MISRNGLTVRKNRWKFFVVIDCPADSGAAEMYTADEHKMAASPNQMAMSELWNWETKSVIERQKRHRREYREQEPGRQFIKQLSEQFQEASSVLH